MRNKKNKGVIEIHNFIPHSHVKWVFNNDFLIFNDSENTFERNVFETFKGWIAKIDGEIAGSCLYKVQDPGTKIKRPTWYFAYLGILPKFQSCGVGTKLLNTLLEHADKSRANLECDTSNTNSAALHLYKKHNFVVAETGSYMILTRRPQRLKI